jgi:CRP-like cAMP-binding protein
VAEYGPGSLHGERAVLEGGTRTATVRAVTACKLAIAPASGVDRDALVALSAGHRHEDTR